ncbi:hypothetical protein EON81_07675 [bacterium]|nr:MAG: hypothetical protein EON81_07675 [bacterium]
MVCPNCGQAFEGNRCPNCGKPVRSTGNVILSVIVALFLVTPLALFGACSAFFGATSLGGADRGFGLLMLALAAIAIGAAFGLGILAKKLWK